jgi:Secretion system C-terminal sorting domain
VSTSSGILFYRLRMVDNNNQVSYSSIKAIRPPKSEAAPEILVYPNPVKEAFSLTLPGSWQRKEISVELVSASGVRIRLFHIKNASQTEEISLGSIPRGNYLVVVHCEDQTAQKKIFKD